MERLIYKLLATLNDTIVQINKLRQRVCLWLNRPLTQAQIAGWAEVARDIGQVVFASLVVGGIIDKDISLIIVAAGTVVSLLFWLVAHQLNARIKL